MHYDYRLAQSCSHIGGLLFHLHHLHLHEVLKSDSATSKQCMWNVPRPIKMEPKPLKEWNFAKPKLQESGEIEHRTTDGRKLGFDPRHPTQRSFNICHSLEQLKLLKTQYWSVNILQHDLGLKFNFDYII